jgi:hypothetical protein
MADICLIDNGKNIHKQQFEISAYFTPFKIQNLVEIVNWYSTIGH